MQYLPLSLDFVASQPLNTHIPTSAASSLAAAHTEIELFLNYSVGYGGLAFSVISFLLYFLGLVMSVI